MRHYLLSYSFSGLIIAEHHGNQNQTLCVNMGLYVLVGYIVGSDYYIVLLFSSHTISKDLVPKTVGAVPKRLRRRFGQGAVGIFDLQEQFNTLFGICSEL